MTDEGLSDSDDEYLPVSVDEDVTDSEHEEAVHVARKNDPEKVVELQPLDHHNLLILTVLGRQHSLLQAEVFHHHLITTSNRAVISEQPSQLNIIECHSSSKTDASCELQS